MFRIATCSAGQKVAARSAFTRAEAISVTALSVMLSGLLMPLLLQARDLARQQSSLDNLNRIGGGLLAHAETFGVLPSNGGPSAESVITPDARTYNPSETSPYEWGFGDPRRAGRQQPGSWAFAILPYIGEQTAFAARNHAAVVPCFYTPGRRPVAAETALEESDPVYPGWVCLPDGANPWGKTDYAGNDQVMRGGVGNVKRLTELKDGLSVTVLAGEKAMDSRAAGKGGWYWDEPFILGGSGGTGRKGNRLLADGPIGEEAADQWGSPQTTGVGFVFADGAARTLSYATSPEILTRLIKLGDGGTLPGHSSN